MKINCPKLQKRPSNIIKATNGPVIEKFEKLWQKPKYRNPKLLKALSEPATKRSLVARPDWDDIYAEIKANPNATISIAGQPQKASSLIKNVEENYGGNPNDLLPNMQLDEALIQKHSSVMRKVPRATELNPATGRREGMGKMAGLGAESRDKKRQQKQTGKTHAKKEDMGPQPDEFVENFAEKGPDGKIHEDYVFTAQKIDDPESDFDLDKFNTYAVEHGDDILEVRDVSTGVTAKMTLEDFAEKLDMYINEGKYETTINKFLRGNVHLFAKFDEAVDADALAADAAAYQKALDEFHAKKNEPVEEVEEDILPDREYDLEENWEDAPNPEAWSPEKAKQFGIDDDHSVLTPQEIALIQTPMEARDIRAFITKPEDGITKKELDELRAFTGKTDPKEVADEFIKLRQLYRNSLKKKPAKPVTPKREAEVKDTLAEIHIESAKIADEITSSPVALDEVAQRAFRIADYQRALTAPLPPELTGVIKPEFVADIARQAVKKSIEFQTRQGKFKTGEGFQTMTESIENGGAWRPDRWGSDSQIALHSTIWNSVKDLRAATGGSNLTVKRKAYMAILDIADKELRAMGVEPFLNHVTQKVGKKGIQHPVNLSYYDILKALGDEKHGGLLNFMVTGIRSYQPTQVQGAAETIIRLRASGAPEDIIRKRAIRELIGGKVNGAFATEKYGRPASNAARADEFTKNRVKDMGSKAQSPMEGVRGRVKDARAIVDALMEPNTYRALNTQMMVNHAAHASALGKNVSDLVEETVNTLRGIGTNAGDSAEMLGYMRNSLKDISTRFSPSDIEQAKSLFNAKMAEHVSEAERISTVQSTNRATLIRPPEAVVTKQMEEQAAIIPSGKNAGKPASTLFVHDQPAPMPKQAEVNKSHVNEVEAAEREVMKNAPTDAEDFEIIGASIAAAAMRKIHPFQKYVNPRLGLTDNVYRQVNSGMHSVARQQAEFHGSLLTHLAKYGDNALLDDFRELQALARAGGPVNKDNPFLLPLDASESLRELYGIISVMFSKSAYNVFARNGVGANHFNSLAKASGLPEKWRFQQGVDAYTNSSLWTTWEGIEEKGVLDFLSRMHSIAVKSSQDIAIAASFSKNFGKATPAPGLVKITWNNRKAKDMETSVFYDLIDKDLYYPKEVATQVTTIDRLLTETRHIDPKTSFGKFIANVFDPVTNALKASQTTVRPGHWTISVAGDLMRNQIAGVNTFAPYKHAAKIMMEGKKMLSGEGDDFLNKIASAKELHRYSASQELSNGFTGTSKGSGVTLFVGGKKVNVNYETMNKLVRDVVMLPKHRGGGVLEDRFIDHKPTNKLANALQKGTDFVTDNEKFSLNEWAARRDNLMRVSLAVDYASKRRWKNLQEMKDGMEEYVTKWAPTSTDFTSFEAVYARRTLLYYTWLRGITPRIIDAAMTKPGVTTIVPKALYNMAYANGLNPESIGDPFPEEGMFPDYYRNGVLGPQWKDDFGTWGINPSSPVIEVANTFNKFKLGDPVGNTEGALSQIGGMATPFARIPAELATGTQASTGVPIEDNAQYLADNLGGSWLSSLSRATGKTLNGDGIVDRTDSAAKDTPELQAEHAKLQGINFLTGAKLTDYQSESAQKAAAYDLRDEYRDPALRAERSK